MATHLPPVPALAPSPSPMGISVASRPKAVCPDATLKPGDHIVRAVSGSGRDSDGRDFYVYNCACGRSSVEADSGVSAARWRDAGHSAGV